MFGQQTPIPHMPRCLTWLAWAPLSHDGARRRPSRYCPLDSRNV
jgi:hypothetical protein